MNAVHDSSERDVRPYSFLLSLLLLDQHILLMLKQEILTSR